MKASMAVILTWLVLGVAQPAAAQPLGTYRWQLRPFCNIVTVTVTQVGSVYRLEGTDDRCGVSVQSSVIGTAFMNPDGTVGMGFNVVGAPGGQDMSFSATVALTTLNGAWEAGGGADSGVFTFTPGAGTGGVPRPAPSPVSPIPSVIRLQPDGGLVAGGTLNTGTIPAAGLGTRMMWHPRKAAFRAGHLTLPAWDEVNVGLYSVAFGLDTVASGASSAAFGQETLASGLRSAAFGNNTRAPGENSFAMGQLSQATNLNTLAVGYNTVASGVHSQAFGYTTVASGFASTALGISTQALGAYSLAAGANAIARATSSMAVGNAEVAATAHGSFAFGDVSTSSRILADIAGQFKVRASGGVRFATNATETAGVQMTGGSSQWSQLSDVNTKHRFRELGADEVLRKIATLPVTEWSYLAQDDAIRHIGPTAQDFHAAFGLGEDPRYIGSLDADGVALAAVKALEARTRDLADRNAALEALTLELKDANAALAALVEELRREIRR